MADGTRIEWTDASWNPVTGCTKVTRGCDLCYAERFAERFRGVSGHHYEHGFDLVLRPERLELPVRWKRPRRIFVTSMGDLHHKAVPEDFVDAVYAVMERCPQHRFQVLTKRSARMRRYLKARWSDTAHAPAHIWVGVSVEDADSDARLAHLRDTPAAVRFVSAEPLLGALDDINLDGIDWLIAGGESGPGARPMDPQWARGLREACARSRCAFFFKQWGGATSKAGGRLLDGRTHDAMPPDRADRAPDGVTEAMRNAHPHPGALLRTRLAMAAQRAGAEGRERAMRAMLATALDDDNEAPEALIARMMRAGAPAMSACAVDEALTAGAGADAVRALGPDIARIARADTQWSKHIARTAIESAGGQEQLLALRSRICAAARTNATPLTIADAAALRPIGNDRWRALEKAPAWIARAMLEGASEAIASLRPERWRAALVLAARNARERERWRSEHTKRALDALDGWPLATVHPPLAALATLTCSGAPPRSDIEWAACIEAEAWTESKEGPTPDDIETSMATGPVLRDARVEEIALAALARWWGMGGAIQSDLLRASHARELLSALKERWTPLGSGGDEQPRLAPLASDARWDDGGAWRIDFATPQGLWAGADMHDEPEAHNDRAGARSGPEVAITHGAAEHGRRDQTLRDATTYQAVTLGATTPRWAARGAREPRPESARPGALDTLRQAMAHALDALGEPV